jgi:cell division protein FtsX
MKQLTDLNWIKFLLGEKVLYIVFTSIMLSLVLLLMNLNMKDTIKAKQESLQILTLAQKDPNYQSSNHTNANEYDRFYAQFPTEQQLTAILEEIHQFADEFDINLYEGEYQLKANRNPLLMQYTIKLPTSAHYQSLKQLIEKTELKFPTLSLRKVELKRDAVDEDSPNVTLSYQLLVKRNASITDTK